MRFSIFQDTLLGQRQVNQDRMGYCFTRDALLMVVADGMGGHPRGELAAQVAMQTIAAEFQGEAKPLLPDVQAFLDSAVRRAHREILRLQTQQALPESPRTTVVACVVQQSQVWWAHAGDTRCYLIRDGEVLRRTRDHSKVQSLLSLGLIQPGEEDHHPERNKVLNCLGSPFEPTVEISAPVKLQPGDRILLCSDGVWGGLPEADLVRVASNGSVQAAVPSMVRRAVLNSGRAADNATAMLMDWEGETIADTLSSLDLPEGAFTSTIAQVLPHDPDAPSELSEDDIERTIREIRNAIDKSVPSKTSGES
jgi:serine/threonine protein phosphatase PrpC